MNWFKLALAGMILNAIGSIFCALAVRGGGWKPASFWAAIWCLLVLVPITRVEWPGMLNWVWATCSGICLGIAWVCYDLAIIQGKAGPVSSIYGASCALSAVLAGIILKETLTAKDWIGVLLVALGAALLGK